MGFFSKKRDDAPPPYQQQSGEAMGDRKRASILQTPASPPFAPPSDEIRIISYTSNEVYRFSRTQLVERSCKNIVKLSDLNAKNGGDLKLGANLLKNKRNLYTHFQIDKAMELLVEWVETGKIKPCMRHLTNNAYQYVLLRVIADYLDCEKLSNDIMDELITYYSELRAVPTMVWAKELYTMTDGRPPTALVQLILQLWLGNPQLIESYFFPAKGTWSGYDEIERSMLLLLIKKQNNETSYIFYPSKSNRCKYHNHRETQPCSTRKSTAVQTERTESSTAAGKVKNEEKDDVKEKEATGGGEAGDGDGGEGSSRA